MLNAKISAETAPLVTFVQTWTTTSVEHQDKWIATMRRSVGALTGQPGFISMSIHRGEDGKHIAVYAQWRTAVELQAAIQSPAAKAGHAEMVEWAVSDGGATYTVANVFGPSTDDASDLEKQTKQRWADRRFETRRVRANGVDLHVVEAGTGDPVILLHGYPQSGESWRLIAPELARAHRIVIPDLRGMGLSEAPARGYDLETVAEDIHQLAVALGMAKVKVVGSDWGAAVGAVYAMRYRDEVAKLAFLESSLPGAGFESALNFSQRNDLFTFVPFLLMGQSGAGDTTATLIDDREAVYLHHLWDTFTGDKVAAPFSTWEPYVAAMTRTGVSSSGASYYRALYESAAQVRTLIERKLDIPVLAIAGEKGVGKNHETLVRAFATNVRNLIVPGAGHFLAEERPQQTLDALRAFLAE